MIQLYFLMPLTWTSCYTDDRTQVMSVILGSEVTSPQANYSCMMCSIRDGTINPWLPLVREKSGKFKVREKSGNFVLGQGNLRF